jgi:hypothetical protein
MKKIINETTHIGDILAIPFFGLLTYYFYVMENKTFFEWILFLFSLAGFLIDGAFTILYFTYFKVPIIHK